VVLKGEQGIMTKDLILMRHGKSDWGKPVSDYLRPIKKRGFLESSRIGIWLHDQGLVPQLIISSPAQRARETAESVAQQMNYSAANICWNESIYMADVSELLDAIATTPEECQSLMVVGHNPGLEDLLFYLTEEIDIPDDGKVMPTATVAVLETELDWSALEHSCCKLGIIARGRYL
jgi:phosphohistidine phosphatase